MRKITATDVYTICQLTNGLMDKVDYEKIQFSGEVSLPPGEEYMMGTFMTKRSATVFQYLKDNASADPENGHLIAILDDILGIVMPYSDKIDYQCVTFNLPCEAMMIVVLANQGKMVLPIGPLANSSKRFTIFIPTLNDMIPKVSFVLFTEEENPNSLGVSVAIAF